MTILRRLAPLVAFLVGSAVFLLVLPFYEAPQPHGLEITRAEARRIADGAARKVGIDVEEAWAVTTWEALPIVEQELADKPELRRQAVDDPVIGPRLGGFRTTYFRRGLEKYPTYGHVIVGKKGEVIAARRFARAETPGARPTAEQLRPAADEWIAATPLAGAPGPVFESVRPTVRNSRIDHVFLYRVPTTFPAGRVAFFAAVYFIGDQPAGWELIEEYADGTPFRYDSGQGVVQTFVRFATVFGLLLLLVVIFLRKYHAGEVGVRTASAVFAAVLLLSLLFQFFTAAEQSLNMGLGGADAQLTAIAIFAFVFLFLHLPLSVVSFLASSVGESYAHERWGERLAAFDSILRRDPFNATAARSVLTGVLLAPAVAAGTLLPPLAAIIPGFATPTLFPQSAMLLSSGGPVTLVIQAGIQALVIPVVVLLFILGLARANRALPLGIVAAIIVGAALGAADPPLFPELWALAFAFGAPAVLIAIFFAWDLLAASVALFGGTILLGAVPLLRAAEGAADSGPLIALTAPLIALVAYAVVGLLTNREVVYAYEDLAPHVRRIIERERVKAEIEAANRIQSALLPAADPIVNNMSIVSHYRAATEIGGDYFDYLPVGNDRIGLAFGDVAGHGLTSGIVMAMAKSALLVQLDYDSHPARVMDVLNQTVIRTAPKRMLMTFFFGILDPVARTLRFSTAGHLDPYIYRAATQRIEPLSAWGFPLGVRRREPFQEIEVGFDAGDRLILYSDGLIEALDDDEEPFGFQRFERVLLEHGEQTAEDIRKAILNAVRRFTRNRPPEDDQTLVVIAFERERSVVAARDREAPLFVRPEPAD